MNRQSRHRRGGYIGQAWLVLGLSLCFGAALAGVQIVWGPKIEENRRQKALREVPGVIGEVTLTDPDTDREFVARAVPELTEEIKDADGKLFAYRAYWQARDPGTGQLTGPKVFLGYAIRAKGDGYADRIELLIGVDDEVGEITGISVFAQNETPGLGNKIKLAKWRDQFRGLKVWKKLTVLKSGARPENNEIDAVTSATISSQSVCKIVGDATGEFRADLADPKLQKLVEPIDSESE